MRPARPQPVLAILNRTSPVALRVKCCELDTNRSTSDAYLAALASLRLKQPKSCYKTHLKRMKDIAKSSSTRRRTKRIFIFKSTS